MKSFKEKCEEAAGKDNAEESELSSSDSDDMDEFYFRLYHEPITRFKRKKKTLKRAFSYLENYSLIKETIFEENELNYQSSEDDVSCNTDTDVTSESSSEVNDEIKVLDQETNEKKETMERNKELSESKDIKNANGSTSKSESSADDDDGETTKCFAVFIAFFRRISSIVCFGFRRKNKIFPIV
ncbi:uncharacterized protein LOC111632773 [Centruroides sculpturatus]|uniref:uncharacterized protein LOC111632773 n=1 Tax=Centruroides sculpturatus TaxID=218467 RepID=UPI000C6DDA3B|nr:uncharacterized protein LOC111632773 [Centruroides sculpturatus]